MEDVGSGPEPSLGTHFFNDLVEANIAPLAIHADLPGTVFKEEFFLRCPNLLASRLPEFEAFSAVARLIHVPSCADGRFLQVYMDGEKEEGLGFLARPGETE